MVTNADDATGRPAWPTRPATGPRPARPRWNLVGKVTTVESANYYFTTGVGNYIYFANANNSGGGAQYFKSFNVTTSAFADESKTNNPLCACGYEGDAGRASR